MSGPPSPRRHAVAAVRVVFVIRPELPPCFTCILRLPAHHTRIADVLLAASQCFVAERERGGPHLWAPLPSNDVLDFALYSVDAQDYLRSTVSCATTIALGASDADGGHAREAVVDRSLRVGSECAPRALLSRLISRPVHTGTPTLQGVQGTFAVLLKPHFLLREHIAAVETVTREQIEMICFQESFVKLTAWGQERRSQAVQRQSRRECHAQQRDSVETREAYIRGKGIEQESQWWTSTMSDFATRYRVLEGDMMQQYTKMSALRQALRNDMAKASSTRLQ